MEFYIIFKLFFREGTILKDYFFNFEYFFLGGAHLDRKAYKDRIR